MCTQATNLVQYRRIARHYHASLRRRHVLVREETERRRVSPTPHLPNSRCMRRIFNQRQSARICERAPSTEVHGVPTRLRAELLPQPQRVPRDRGGHAGLSLSRSIQFSPFVGIENSPTPWLSRRLLGTHQAGFELLFEPVGVAADIQGDGMVQDAV
jgi:hypothetical protein